LFSIRFLGYFSVPKVAKVIKAGTIVAVVATAVLQLRLLQLWLLLCREALAAAAVRWLS